MNKILIVLAGVVIVALGFRYFVGKGDIKVGNSAPDFEATLTNGTDFRLSDLRGNYVLIDFWGSWCGPCRRENSSLVKLYQDFENKKSNRREGFKILNIALEKIEGRAEAAIKKDNLFWENHIISISRVVLMSPLANKFKVTSIPTKFLLNAKGKIMSINPSLEEVREMLAENLE